MVHRHIDQKLIRYTFEVIKSTEVIEKWTDVLTTNKILAKGKKNN